LQWASRFSRRREGKEEGRETPLAEALPYAISAHAPCHHAWGGEEQRTPPWKTRFSAVLAPHVPPD